MSIMNKKFSRCLLFLGFLQILTIFCFGQSLKININVSPQNPSELNINGKFSGEVTERNLLFLLSYADSDNLGSRVGNLELFDYTAQKINYKKIAEGSFVAEQPFNSFSYRTNAAIPANVLSTAHTSWVSTQNGVLRLNDLLPVFETKYSTNVSLELPADWKISTVEKSTEHNNYSIEKNENAVFVIGKGWSNQTFRVSGANINLILDDQWKIEKSVVEKIIKDILLKYENYFGVIPEKNLQIINFKFPKDVGFERWRGETNGANVIIMSAPTTFESQTRQRIQEQLRHELFHLWMPNNLALSGDYSWFYEGFAQYTALRIGVGLNQISFNDFLNTLEQSYNLGNRRSQPISLIEASKNRWLGETSSVYAKGLAVAFLIDTALLRESNGKRDLISVLRQIYDKHKKPNKTEDGNTAILKLFDGYRELSPIINDYVGGAEKLNFERYLQHTGIEILPVGTTIKLKVKDRLTGREKDFLDNLGYNDWRKILLK